MMKWRWARQDGLPVVFCWCQKYPRISIKLTKKRRVGSASTVCVSEWGGWMTERRKGWGKELWGGGWGGAVRSIPQGGTEPLRDAHNLRSWQTITCPSFVVGWGTFDAKKVTGRGAWRALSRSLLLKDVTEWCHFRLICMWYDLFFFLGGGELLRIWHGCYSGITQK